MHRRADAPFDQESSARDPPPLTLAVLHAASALDAGDTRRHDEFVGTGDDKNCAVDGGTPQGLTPSLDLAPSPRLTRA